jgi:hypothetical protein
MEVAITARYHHDLLVLSPLGTTRHGKKLEYGAARPRNHRAELLRWIARALL